MGRPKKSQNMHNLKGPKRRRELTSFMLGNYFTHNLFNVTNMQIVRLIVVRGLEQASPAKWDSRDFGAP